MDTRENSLIAGYSIFGTKLNEKRGGFKVYKKDKIFKDIESKTEKLDQYFQLPIGIETKEHSIILIINRIKLKSPNYRYLLLYSTYEYAGLDSQKRPAYYGAALGFLYNKFIPYGEPIVEQLLTLQRISKRVIIDKEDVNSIAVPEIAFYTLNDKCKFGNIEINGNTFIHVDSMKKENIEKIVEVSLSNTWDKYETLIFSNNEEVLDYANTIKKKQVELDSVEPKYILTPKTESNVNRQSIKRVIVHNDVPPKTLSELFNKVRYIIKNSEQEKAIYEIKELFKSFFNEEPDIEYVLEKGIREKKLMKNTGYLLIASIIQELLNSTKIDYKLGITLTACNVIFFGRRIDYNRIKTIYDNETSNLHSTIEIINALCDKEVYSSNQFKFRYFFYLLKIIHLDSPKDVNEFWHLLIAIMSDKKHLHNSYKITILEYICKYESVSDANIPHVRKIINAESNIDYALKLNIVLLTLYGLIDNFKKPTKPKKIKESEQLESQVTTLHKCLDSVYRPAPMNVVKVIISDADINYDTKIKLLKYVLNGDTAYKELFYNATMTKMMRLIQHLKQKRKWF